MLAHQLHPKLLRLLATLVAVVLAVGLLAVLGIGLSQVNASSAATGIWEPTGGPLAPGGQVKALVAQRVFSGTAYVPQNTLYAIVGAANSGAAPKVYRSDNGADSWQTIFTSTGSLDALDVAGDTVYLAGNSSIYRSLNQGLTWTEVFTGLQNGLQQSILALAVNPVQTNTVYAAGWEFDGTANWSIVLRTNDGGTTWTRVLTTPVPAPHSGTSFNVVAINPLTPTTVYVAGAESAQASYDQNAAIFRTTNGGDTWTRVYSNTHPRFVSLVVSPFTPTLIFAGTPPEGQPGRVLRSTDGGEMWSQVTAGAGLALAIESPNSVYATSASGNINQSSDGGDTWHSAGNVPNYHQPFLAGQTALYAGGNSGIWKSADGGSNWTDTNTGIQSLVGPRSIAIDPHNPARMLVGTDSNGGWVTMNGGVTWTQPTGSGWPSWNPSMRFAINPAASNIVYAGIVSCHQGNVLRSADGGASFTPVYTSPVITQPNCTGYEQINAIAIAPSMTSTVYAAGKDSVWSSNGEYAIVVRSLNDGASWTQVFTLPMDSEVEVLAIDPQDARVVYAGGEDCSGPCAGFVYRSVNDGNTWSKILTPTQTTRSIVIDPQKPSVLYAATDGYSVYKSNDGGDTWSVVRRPPWEGGSPSGNLLAIDPKVPSHIYLGGWGYIAETVDGGSTWSENDPINQGTPGMEPSALTVDNRGLTQTLYAGFSGLWRYERLAPQPGSAMTLTLSSSALTVTAGSAITFTSKVVDQFENWVADGTVVTFTSPGFFITTTAQVNAGYAVARLTALKPGTPIVAANTGAASATVAIAVQPHRVFLPIVIR